MVSIADRITSIRQTVGGSFSKPSLDQMKEFEVSLWKNKEPLSYLKGRGLDDTTIKHFRLGFDERKNAICIPMLKDETLINIKYRYIQPNGAKYSSEKGAETWIYNEGGVKQGIAKGAVLIVEGEFDLMKAWQAGIKNVVSPASGKDSYGVWIELLDQVPKIYIAYDNDSGGKATSIKLAERLGVDKCYEVLYPDGINDANDYLLKYTGEEYKALIKEAQPFYKRQFKGLGDVLISLRKPEKNIIKTDLIPKVNLEKDWLVVISGKENVGKTSYVMNLADDLTRKKIPVLVLPFERGIDSVGKRFLMIKYDKTLHELSSIGHWIFLSTR